MTRCPPVAQKRRQRRTHQPRGARDRDRQRRQTPLGGPLVRGDITGQLAMPVGEHRPQHKLRNWRADPVGHPGPVHADLVEFMDMPPPQRNPSRQRRWPAAPDRVGEKPGRIVEVRLVLGHPAQAPRQRHAARPFASEAASAATPHRLPRRGESGDRAGPRVPGEYLAARGVDDAGIHHTHRMTLDFNTGGHQRVSRSPGYRLVGSWPVVLAAPRRPGDLLCRGDQYRVDHVDGRVGGVHPAADQ